MLSGQYVQVFGQKYPASKPKTAQNVWILDLASDPTFQGCDDPLLTSLDIHFFSREKQSFDVMNMTSVQCLVGRVKAGGSSWEIIDRSGKLAQAIFEEWSAEEEDLV